jgi:putative addiction module killer protein
VARRPEGQTRAAAHRGAPTADRGGNLGNWQPIEGEVSEMRVHYGPGYRLYFVRRGRVIVVMLNAGDKSTQKRDIRHALKLASELGDDL